MADYKGRRSNSQSQLNDIKNQLADIIRAGANELGIEAKLDKETVDKAVKEAQKVIDNADVTIKIGAAFDTNSVKARADEINEILTNAFDVSGKKGAADLLRKTFKDFSGVINHENPQLTREMSESGIEAGLAYCKALKNAIKENVADSIIEKNTDSIFKSYLGGINHDEVDYAIEEYTRILGYYKEGYEALSKFEGIDINKAVFPDVSDTSLIDYLKEYVYYMDLAHLRSEGDMFSAEEVENTRSVATSSFETMIRSAEMLQHEMQNTSKQTVDSLEEEKVKVDDILKSFQKMKDFLSRVTSDEYADLFGFHDLKSDDFKAALRELENFDFDILKNLGFDKDEIAVWEARFQSIKDEIYEVQALGRKVNRKGSTFADDYLNEHGQPAEVRIMDMYDEWDKKVNMIINALKKQKQAVENSTPSVEDAVEKNTAMVSGVIDIKNMKESELKKIIIQWIAQDEEIYKIVDKMNDRTLALTSDKGFSGKVTSYGNLGSYVELEGTRSGAKFFVDAQGKRIRKPRNIGEGISNSVSNMNGYDADKARNAFLALQREVENTDESIEQTTLTCKEFFEQFGSIQDALDQGAFAEMSEVLKVLGKNLSEIDLTGLSENDIEAQFAEQLIKDLELSEEELKVIRALLLDIATIQNDPSGSEVERYRKVRNELDTIFEIAAGIRFVTEEDLANADKLLGIVKEIPKVTESSSEPIKLEELSRDKIIKWIQDLKKATIAYDEFQAKIANDEPYDEDAFRKAEENYKKFYDVLKEYETLTITLKDNTQYSLIDDLEAEDWDVAKSHIKSIVIEKKEESETREENTNSTREETAALDENTQAQDNNTKATRKRLTEQARYYLDKASTGKIGAEDVEVQFNRIISEMQALGESTTYVEQQFAKAKEALKMDEVVENADKGAEAVKKEANSAEIVDKKFKKAKQSKSEFNKINKQTQQEAKKGADAIEEEANALDSFPENTDLLRFLQQIQQGTNTIEFSIAIDKEMAISEIKKIAPEIAEAFNAQYGTSITSNQVVNAYQSAQRQLQAAEKERYQMTLAQMAAEQRAFEQREQARQHSLAGVLEEAQARREAARAQREEVEDAQRQAIVRQELNERATNELEKQAALERDRQDRETQNRYVEMTRTAQNRQSDEIRATLEAQNNAIEKQYEAYKNILKINEELARITSDNKSDELKKASLEEKKAEYQRQYLEARKEELALGRSADSNAEHQVELAKMREASEKKIVDIGTSQIKNLEKTIGTYQNKIRSILLGKNTKDFKDKFDYQVGGSFGKQLETIISRINNLDINDVNFSKTIKSIIQDFYKLKDAIDDTLGEKGLSKNKEAARSSLAKLKKNVADIIDLNSNMGKSYLEQFENIRIKIDTANSNEEVENLKADIVELNTEIIRLGRNGKSAFQEFREAVSTKTSQLFAQFFSFQDWLRYTREAFETIKELDYSLVDLRKTTKMTADELNGFYYNSNNLAKQLGVTTKEIIDQASAWSRLGFSTREEAEQMAQLSSKFATISPGMDTSTAQEGLVSIMKAYDIGVENVERDIMDNVNKLGNTFAESNEDIVSGMERAAASLAVTGTSLQDALALFTGGQEILQNSEKMGTALRSISLRIRGYSEETEELDEDLSNITGDLADLTKTVAHPLGISIFKEGSTTEFKSLVDYLREVSEIWDEMSDKQQNDFLQKAFAKTQANAGAAIIQNFSQVEEALKVMQEAQGSAEEEMSIASDSITFKLNALQQTWVGIIQKLVDRGTIGKILDFLTALSEALGKVIDTIGLFPTTTILATLRYFIVNFDILDKKAEQWRDRINTVKSGFDAIKNSASSVKVVVEELQELGQTANTVEHATESIHTFADTLNTLSYIRQADTSGEQSWWSDFGEVLNKADLADSADDAKKALLGVIDDIGDESKKSWDEVVEALGEDTFGEITDATASLTDSVMDNLAKLSENNPFGKITEESKTFSEEVMENLNKLSEDNPFGKLEDDGKSFTEETMGMLQKLSEDNPFGKLYENVEDVKESFDAVSDTVSDVDDVVNNVTEILSANELAFLDAGSASDILTGSLTDNELAFLEMGSASELAAGELVTVDGAMTTTTTAATGAATAVKGLGVALKGLIVAHPILAAIAGIAAATMGIVAAFDAATTSLEEWNEKISETEGKITSLKSSIKQLEDTDFRTQDEQDRLELLRSELQYQERLLEVEKQRANIQKYGTTTFSQAWDPENANNVYLEDAKKRGTAGLFATASSTGYDSSVVNKAASDIEKYNQELKNLDESSEEYGKTLKKKEDAELKAADSLQALYTNTADYKQKLSEAQEAQKGFVEGSNEYDNAQSLIDKYSAWIEENEEAIERYEKAIDKFNYSSVINSMFSKVEFDGLEDKLKDLAKSGTLTRETLENTNDEAIQSLVSQLDDAGVNAETLYNWLMRISGIVDKSNLSDKITSHMGSYSTADKARIDNYFDSLTQDQLQLVAGLDIDWSAYKNGEEVIAKLQSELDKAKGNPLQVGVESTIIDSVEGINKRLKPQFDVLGELYQSIFYGDNGKFSLDNVTNDQLKSLTDAFLNAEDENGNKIGVKYEGATTAVNDFIDTITSAETKSKSLDEQQRVTQEAVNKLATTYFYAADGLRELNDESADAIKQQFKQMGITNMDVVIDAYVEYKTNANAFANLKQDVAQQMKELEQGGSVDLLLRPVIDSQILNDVGWEAGQGVATVFSSTFSNEAGDVAINFTPIIADENGNYVDALEPEALEEYAENVINGVHDDYLNLQIGAKFEGEDAIQKASEAAERIHELQDVYYNFDSILLDVTEDTVAETEARLEAVGAVNAHKLVTDALNAKLEAEALQTKAVEAATSDMKDETENASELFVQEAQMSNLAKVYLVRLVAAQTVFSNQDLNTADKIAELSNLANAYLGAAAQAEFLNKVSNTAAGGHGTISPELAWQQVLEEFSLLDFEGIDFSPITKDASKGGKDAADAWVEAYEKEKKALETQYGLGLMNERQYLEKLKALIDKFFKDRAKYAEKYMEEMKSYMDALLSHYNSVISGVTTLLNHRKSDIEEQKETIITALEEEKEAAEERYQAEIDAIEETIKAREAQIEAIQKQIDAINDANAAREREINLQKAQYELERARNQRTKLVCFYANRYSNVS